jgi:hypothetical protein
MRYYPLFQINDQSCHILAILSSSSFNERNNGSIQSPSLRSCLDLTQQEPTKTAQFKDTVTPAVS